MTYEKAVEKINSLLRFGMQPGLERIEKLLLRLGSPQNHLSFVHVAGTNGKGSTCTMISSVLCSAGYKTGLFLSPFVTEFRERIQVSGEMIPKEKLAGLLEIVMPLVEQMAKDGEVVTEFELITTLALLWFREENCDIVVLEVGLGGRFDATNIIKTPLVSVITHISFDHTTILGDTIEKIAFEKAGIIKENGVTVVYSDQFPDAVEVIKQVAKKKRNRIVFSDYSETIVESKNIDGTDFRYRGKAYHLPLVGEHQIKNAATALKAIEILCQKGFIISDQAILDGLKSAFFAARMEVLSKQPLVILDGAHNPDGAQALKKAIQDYVKQDKIVGIIGMLRDKDYKKSLSYLAPCFSDIIIVSPNQPRALSCEEFCKEAKQFCLNVIATDSLSNAAKQAFKLSGPSGAVVICGSLYLASEIRPIVLDFLNG